MKDKNDFKDYSKSVAERIRELRLASKLSADELGEKIGKHRATIYRYESGDISNIPISIVTPLAKALKTNTDYILGYSLDSRPYSQQLIDMGYPIPSDFRADVDDYEERCRLYKIELFDKWDLSNDDPDIIERELNLDRISDILADAGYSLGYETYDDDIFYIKNSKNQIVNVLSDGKLLAAYKNAAKFGILSYKTFVPDNANSEFVEKIDMSRIVFNDYFPLHYCINLSGGSFDEILEAEPDAVVYVPIVFQSKRKRLHAFQINGTSMNNVFPDHSIVVVEDNSSGIKYKDGTIVVAYHEGEATVKRFYAKEDGIVLMPDSSDKSHLPIVIPNDEQLLIFGHVIWHMNPEDIAKYY